MRTLILITTLLACKDATPDVCVGGALALPVESTTTITKGAVEAFRNGGANEIVEHEKDKCTIRRLHKWTFGEDELAEILKKHIGETPEGRAEVWGLSTYSMVNSKGLVTLRITEKVPCP
jgi:hypothetical protein